MADIIKPLNEIARQSRKTANSVAVSRTVLPESVTLSAGTWSSLPSNLRSVTFVLWGVNGTDTVSIAFPNTTKLFDDARYEGFTLTYSIDLDRDCSLSNNIELTVVGSATVDVFYTTTISNS